MSELKAYSSERIYWAVEQVEQEAGDIDDLHLDDNLFYLKYEADKVIAELKESVKGLILDNYLKDKETRHNKYKRCLAMAKLCHWKMGVFIYKKEKSDFYFRWHKRWLELTEKFKELK